MRAIAAIPASALLAGAAFGLFDPEPHVFLTHVLIAASVAAAALGFARRRRWLLAAAASLGFFTGGSLLSSVEWQRAWRPPLRVAFEELARADAGHASPSVAVSRSRRPRSRARARAAWDHAGWDRQERRARRGPRARIMVRRDDGERAGVRATRHLRRRRPLEPAIRRDCDGDRHR